MTCYPVEQRKDNLVIPQMVSPSINTPPIKPRSTQPDFYICDALPASLQLAKVPKSPPLTQSLLPFMAAPIVTTPLQLKPVTSPPTSPVARLLFDLFTQLEDFELKGTLKLPVKTHPNSSRIIQTISNTHLKDKGFIAALGIEFKPVLGPIVIPHLATQILSYIPIFGQAAYVKLLKMNMDPQSRKVHATIEHIVVLIPPITHPFDYDVHGLLDMLEIPPQTMKGNGYDLKVGLPKYPWQLAELVQKILQEKGDKGIQKIIEDVGLDKMVPLFDQGEVIIDGNFSNKKISLAGLNVEFAPLPPGVKHRIRIRGKPLHPMITFHGIRSAEVSDGKSGLRFVNEAKVPDPLRVRLHLNPKSWTEPTVEVVSYKSGDVHFETVIPGLEGQPLRLDLHEGIEIEGFTLGIRKTGPQMDIRKVVAKQVGFEAFGVELDTPSGGVTTLKDFRFRLVNGEPRIEVNVSGETEGTIKFKAEPESHGLMKFKLDKKTFGRIVATKDRVQITGNISTQMPLVEFLVKSDKLAASVRAEIRDAKVSGRGGLVIWPKLKKAVLTGRGDSDALTVEGHQGKVEFIQQPAKMEGWPELKKNLGAAANQVETHMTIIPSNITFSIQKMRFGMSLQSNTGKAILKVEQADMRNIKIKGDMSGKMFVMLPPWGVPKPIVISPKAPFKDAEVRIKRLQDVTPAKGPRKMTFTNVFISGVESKATFSKRDQRRCGIDRQHIHSTVGLFRFSPDDRSVFVKDLDPHFHINLKNPMLGGCIKIK